MLPLNSNHTIQVHDKVASTVRCGKNAMIAVMRRQCEPSCHSWGGEQKACNHIPSVSAVALGSIQLKRYLCFKCLS